MKKTTDNKTKENALIEQNSLNLALKETEKSKEQLLRIQRLVGVGAFEYLPDEEIIILSDEAVSVLGLSAELKYYPINVFGKKVKQGLHEKMNVILKLAAEDKLKDNIQFTFRDDSKNNRHIEMLVEKHGGTVKGSITGVFREITKQKQAELSRKANTQAFEAIFFNSKIAILVLNLKGKIVDFNNSALELFGYTRNEMETINSVKLLVEEDIIDGGRIFARFINSAGKHNSFDYRLKKKNDEVFEVLINIEMTVTSEGEKIYVFINDITNLKKMERNNLNQERMLVQQSKMATLGEMVALIAHQWQQPINSIAMIAQMLEELIEVDEENSKMLNKSVESIMAQVLFMTNTMENFRNFLKPSGVSENFNLFKALKEVIGLYRPQLRHHNVDCELVVDDEKLKDAEVYGYENELKNVVLNILTNARDAIESHCPKKGQINMLLSQRDGKLKISIEDNGGGVSKELLNSIFTPYFSTKGDKGTGLGLYMSKLIITDRMHGIIDLENIEKGLRVNIYLQRVDN
ncbi:MAG: hypothetical protein C0602_13190 [Denitrovibrio sp.]|nr:MAG: hypothetical protein C0602_13190 [Denitrovibrio sp.]